MESESVNRIIITVDNHLTVFGEFAHFRAFRNFLYGRRLRFRPHHSTYPSVAIVNRTLLFETLTDPQT